MAGPTSTLHVTPLRAGYSATNTDGTFREEDWNVGVALSEDGVEQAGMGIGIGDFDLDGNLDIFKTNLPTIPIVLYRNDGKGYFDDFHHPRWNCVETRYVGWGTGIVDLDNDGLPMCSSRLERLPGSGEEAAQLINSIRLGWFFRKRG